MDQNLRWSDRICRIQIYIGWIGGGGWAPCGSLPNFPNIPTISTIRPNGPQPSQSTVQQPHNSSLSPIAEPTEVLHANKDIQNMRLAESSFFPLFNILQPTRVEREEGCPRCFRPNRPNRWPTARTLCYFGANPSDASRFGYRFFGTSLCSKST